MTRLVLLRHGQSVWNHERRFTGWADVDLSEQGRMEAAHAGQLLKAQGFTFDLCYTSYLKRAIKTLWIVLETLDLLWLPVQKSWCLNERHYGAIEGLSRKETKGRYSDEQIRIWQQHFDVPPPALDASDKRFPGRDPRYALLTQTQLPFTESLKDVRARVLPYWHQVIVPQLREGKKVLIVAHGNSLRGLTTYLNNVAEADIPTVQRPRTGEPLVYELDDTMKPVRHYYLKTVHNADAALDRSLNLSEVDYHHPDQTLNGLDPETIEGPDFGMRRTLQYYLRRATQLRKRAKEAFRL